MQLLRLVTALTVFAALPHMAHANQDLARAKNCTACHHPERKMIGPSYKSIAEKYANDEAGAKGLREKIRVGGGGVWGPSPMPAQPQLTPDDAEVLIQWILTLK
jgi:cytochrome c